METSSAGGPRGQLGDTGDQGLDQHGALKSSHRFNARWSAGVDGRVCKVCSPVLKGCSSHRLLDALEARDCAAAIGRTDACEAEAVLDTRWVCASARAAPLAKGRPRGAAPEAGPPRIIRRNCRTSRPGLDLSYSSPFSRRRRRQHGEHGADEVSISSSQQDGPAGPGPAPVLTSCEVGVALELVRALQRIVASHPVAAAASAKQHRGSMQHCLSGA